MQKLLKSPEYFAKYLVAAMLLAVPLYQKFPLISVPGTYVSIRLEDFLLLVALFVVLRVNFFTIRSFFTNKINRSILLFLFVGGVSLLSAIFVTQTVQPAIGLLHLLRRVEYFIPFFLGVYVIKQSRGNSEFFVKVLIVAVFIIFVYGVGQKYLSWPAIATQNAEYSQGIALRYMQTGHLSSTFAGHYDLATFLVLILPIFVGVLSVIKQRKTKMVLYAALVCGIWLIAQSVSRISVVSYLLAISVTLALLRHYRQLVYAVVLSVVLFSMSSNLVARYARIIDVTGQRINQARELLNMDMFQSPRIIWAAEDVAGAPVRKKSKQSEPIPEPIFEDRSTSIRLNVEWPRAIRAFTKNPILGTGYSSITLATDNDYLRILGELGILGFLSFALIFVRIGKTVFARFLLAGGLRGIDRGLVAGYAGAVTGVLTNAVFIDVFEASKFAIIFWLVTGFVIGMVQRRTNE